MHLMYRFEASDYRLERGHFGWFEVTGHETPQLAVPRRPRRRFALFVFKPAAQVQEPQLRPRTRAFLSGEVTLSKVSQVQATRCNCSHHCNDVTPVLFRQGALVLITSRSSTSFCWTIKSGGLQPPLESGQHRKSGQLAASREESVMLLGHGLQAFQF